MKVGLKPDHALMIGDALCRAETAFAGRSESARLDAGVLLGHILGKSRAWIIAHPEIRLSNGQCRKLAQALKNARKGVPLPYLTGHQEFYGLDFFVNEDVLIPRPETELLVELALIWLRSHPRRRTAGDIGTGTGCVAIALAMNLPDLKVYATELSGDAMKVARRNIGLHQFTQRITLLNGDLMTPIPEKLDVLCANLPYIPVSELEHLAVARYEPRLALAGGLDGMDHIRKLLTQSPGFVNPEGAIFLEIEAGQAREVIALAQKTYPSACVRCHPDLARKDRVVTIELDGVSDTMSMELS